MYFVCIFYDFKLKTLFFVLLQICDEQKCQEEVSILTLNYMDRFLSVRSIKKTHLQLLAATCLLLASKLREPSCRALPVKLLVFYTDNSITKKDLIVSINFYIFFLSLKLFVSGHTDFDKN